MPTIRSYRLVSLLSVLLACCAVKSQAEIRLPRLLTDHAVLQRDLPLHIWGWASPAAKVHIRFHGQSMSAVANELGEWSVWMSPESAGGPYSLTVEEEGEPKPVTVSDLLMGDVWLASGQSNMELPLGGFSYKTIPVAVVKNAAAEIAGAANLHIRLLVMGQRSSEYPMQDGTASWTECNPETVAKFSAVAYFFGRAIESAEHVPVGLIDATWGGTPIAAWMSMESLTSDANFMPVFANRARFVRNLDREPQVIAAEKRQDEAAKAAGRPAPPHPRHAASGSWMPAGLYNGMIAPLTSTALKGVIWYQGESDCGPDSAPNYTRLFTALIQDWRRNFTQPELPFLYAQLSTYDTSLPGWPRVRDAQRRALALRSTAMAMTTDVGQPENIHPADKQTVALRLALAARAVAYGEHVAYEPPLFRQAAATGDGMRVWFDHAEGLTSDSAKVQGFEIAGPDRRFYPGYAALESNTVTVKNPSVTNPRYVRYAWTGIAPPAFRNTAGLPASTFTSEEDPPR